MATLKYKDGNEWKKVSIGGGGSTKEVHVGSDTPTDKNIKVWIDPTGTPSGGNGGNAGGNGDVLRVYTIQGDGIDPTFVEDLNSFSRPDLAARASKLLENNIAVYNEIVAGVKNGDPAPIVMVDMGMTNNIIMDYLAGGSTNVINRTMWNNPVSVVAQYILNDGVEKIKVRLIDTSTSQLPTPWYNAGWTLSSDGSCVYQTSITD